METITLKVKVPKDILIAWRVKKSHASRELCKELAVHLFENHILSFGKASELARMSKDDFMSLLGSRKIPLHYDKEDLEEDVKIFKSVIKA